MAEFLGVVAGYVLTFLIGLVAAILLLGFIMWDWAFWSWLPPTRNVAVLAASALVVAIYYWRRANR